MAKQNSDSGDLGDGPVLSDEEWAEFERSFTKESTRSAAYKEPSARQRELTERWRKAQPEDTGWRTDGLAADLSPRGRGGRSGRGGQSGWGGWGGSTGVVRPAARPQRPWLRNVVWIVAAVVVTAVIIGAPKLF